MIRNNQGTGGCALPYGPMQTGEQSVSCLVQKLVLGKHERTAQKRETAGVGEEQNLSGPRRRDENTTFYRLVHFASDLKIPLPCRGVAGTRIQPL